MLRFAKKRKNLLLLLFFAFLIRLSVSPFGTLTLDQNTFIAWSNRLAESGFRNFYQTWSDYLPGYLYILWFLGKLKTFLHIPEVVLYKLPAIFSDVFTGYLIYQIVKKVKNQKIATLSSAVFLFNPAIIANSSLWGQVDSFTSLFSILAIWFLNRNWILSCFFLCFGVLTKPQAVLVVLPIVFLMFQKKWDIKKIVKYGFITAFFFLILFFPFSSGNLINFVIQRLKATLSQYPYTSINSFNFWGVFGFWNKDSSFAQSLGGLITILFPVLLIKKYKKKVSPYLLLAVIFLAGFMFMTRIHERHLLPVFAPLAIASAIGSYLWFIYAGLSVTYLANLYYSFNWITNDFVSVYPEILIKFFILVNLILFALLLLIIFKKIDIKKVLNKLSFLKERKKKTKKTGRMFKKIQISPQRVKLYLIAILIFSFITRIYSLNNPGKEYFDEVYHAFTARRMLNNDPKAWEWWNTPPKGFAYEWTHPPLAKLGMVLGMKVFGENSFGWRFPGALLGTVSILLVYLIAKTIFKDELVGLLSAAVLSLDGLNLVMSRIGMNDIYILAFILLSFYLFLKEKHALSAFSFGLALSSKWSAVWAIPIFLVAHFVFKKKIKKSYLWFLVLPPLVYLASYIPMFLTGHNFDIFIGVQKQMWWYHTRLEATHSYTSSWWSWPLLMRPVYLFTTDEIGKTVSRIYAMGNPAVFWGGLTAILYTIYITLKTKYVAGATMFTRRLGFVVFSFLIFFVPWAASPRIMFLYHYLPSLPFLAIALGFALRRLVDQKDRKIFAVGYLLFTVLLFIYFYPHWAGLKIPLWLDKSYYWFSSWR